MLNHLGEQSVVVVGFLVCDLVGLVVFFLSSFVCVFLGRIGRHVDARFGYLDWVDDRLSHINIKDWVEMRYGSVSVTFRTPRVGQSSGTIEWDVLVGRTNGTYERDVRVGRTRGRTSGKCECDERVGREWEVRVELVVGLVVGLECD